MGYVALYQNKNYILGSFNGNVFSRTHIDEFPVLEKTSVITREFLNKIPNVGYVVNEDSFTIFDKRVSEQCKKVSVPVYVKVFDNYRHTGKVHTFEIPNKFAIKAALKLENTILLTADIQRCEEEGKELENSIREAGGILFINEDEIPDIATICFVNGYERLWKNDHWCIIGAPDMVTSLNLKLYVPECLMAKVIGTGGKNIKKMAKSMRVERIQVLPLEKKSGD